MLYSLAPLEGITDYIFRRAHAQCFPGVDEYYTPFISTNKDHIFAPRILRQLAPENNAGVTLIPQLLGKSADDFLWAANALTDMGYTRINLNLGCPSGTVTAKGKGSGFLQYPDALREFLDTIFAAAPCRIGIKTRLGFRDASGWPQLLDIYTQYPLDCLIVHPRTGAQQYGGQVDINSFALAAERVKDIPLWYNGDLRTAADCGDLLSRFPSVSGLMIGRGLIADPVLVTRIKGLPIASGTLRRFHDMLLHDYPIAFGGESQAMHRMKGVWVLLADGLNLDDHARKELRKVKYWPDFVSLTDSLLSAAERGEDHA